MPVLSPDAFEARLREYVRERSEESRALRAGEKEVSELAAIVARHAALFTRAQLEALRRAHEAERDGPEARERLYRLLRACEGGVASRELAPLQDALQNAELAARVEHGGETLPLRAALARIASVPGYAEREGLAHAAWDVSAGLNPQRLALLEAAEALRAELTGQPDPVARSEEEKQVSLGELAAALERVAAATHAAYAALADRWLDRLLGRERDPVPSAAHAAFLVRLTPLAARYPRERVVEVCAATLADLGLDLTGGGAIRADLEDRPQRAPRPVVIGADPPFVVHLLTRPQGGLQDYQDLLHEAGHALHYAGCDPALPYAFRVLARDYALTEIYSYLLQSVAREPGWHERRLGLPEREAEEGAEAARFLNAFLFRRYLAKLRFELDFWSRFRERGASAEGYAERLTEATGLAYRPDRFLADMDGGFYSADYLRAWVRSAQLRRSLRSALGADWWRRRETGELLRELFWEGLRPSSEEIARRLGFDPLDAGPLAEELGAAGAAPATAR